MAKKIMNDQQVLYEARLAKDGRKLTCAGLVVLGLWVGCGVLLCFRFDSFPSNILALAVLALGAVGLAAQTVRFFRLCQNPGVYRISIDDYGLYVHSDDPSSAPSFSVVGPDIDRLVRTIIKRGDSDSPDDHEYYVETMSGKRHRIEQLFADYGLDVMKLFGEIQDRFPRVEIVEEVRPEWIACKDRSRQRVGPAMHWSALRDMRRGTRRSMAAFGLRVAYESGNRS